MDKNNVTEGLNDAFDLSGSLVSNQEAIPAENQSLRRQNFEDRHKNKQDIEKDYNYARDNIYDVVEKGTEALDYLLEVAKQSDHPRAFEVVSQLTKTLVEANKDLLSLQKTMKNINEQEKKPEEGGTINNNLFVGSTAELQELINGKTN